MGEEQLTPEEAQALEAMEQDTAPVTEDEQAKAETPEPDQTEPNPVEPEGGDPKDPEFKSARASEKPPEGFVPHQAMHAERVKRQELERRLADLEKQREADPEPQYVDPLEDPEGHRRWAEHQSNMTRQQIEAVNNQIAEQNRQQALAQEITRSEAEFSAKTPDYRDAIRHLEQATLQGYQNAGYDQQEAIAAVQRDAMGLIQAAKQIGMNPAELAYIRAQSAGYRKTDVKPEQPTGQPSDADKMAALSKAQQATEGLNSSGAPQSGQLTVKALADMSEDELAELSEADFKKVMGG